MPARRSKIMTTRPPSFRTRRLSSDDAVQRALVYLAEHQDQRVTLNVLAAHVGMTITNFQRTFTRIVGMSPKMYGDALRIGLLKPHGVNTAYDRPQVVDYLMKNTVGRDNTVHSTGNERSR